MLNKANYNNNRKCNFKSKPTCPLDGECITQCMVFNSISATSNNSFVYYGSFEEEFKAWYSSHTKCFQHHTCMGETELSKCVQDLKDHGFDKNLSWTILKSFTIQIWSKMLPSLLIWEDCDCLWRLRNFIRQKDVIDF